MKVVKKEFEGQFSPVSRGSDQFKIKRPSPKIDDGLAFYRTAGTVVRIDDCASKELGDYSPSELRSSIQKSEYSWIRVL